jgi:intracellular septation protein
MLNLFYDFVPLVLFFVAFKFYGIYVATMVGVGVTALQVVIGAIVSRRFDKIQLIMLAVFVILGGMTLYFHDPLFIKWKPTVVYWIFGTALLLSHLIGKKPLMQRMFEMKMEKNKAIVPDGVWKKLNASWSVAFLTLGCVNLYVAYNFSTEVWVNFKLFGTLGFFFIFALLQVVYLSKYISEAE